MLLTIMSKLYKTQGNNIIKDITKGSNAVQQNNISWSYLILGKLALTHIKTKIIIQDLNPNIIPDKNPSTTGEEIMWFFKKSLI